MYHRNSIPMVAFAAVSAIVAPTRAAQSFYVVSKTQNELQTSSTAPVALPVQPYSFSAQSPSAATLTLPAGATAPLVYVANDSSYEINAAFTTKATLDAAYPDGMYHLSGTGFPALTFDLSVDAYSASTPQVTGATWSAGGVLVLDPAVANTLNFAAFSDYATIGSAGHEQLHINGVTDNVNLKNQVVTKSGFGITVQATPFTSYAIPAGTLTAGHVYQCELDYDGVVTSDVSTIPGGAVVSTFGKHLVFYIGAQASGQTYAPPVITTQPANVTTFLGGTATVHLAYTVNGGPPDASSSVLWYVNGQMINFNGTKYVFQGGDLVINNVTSADAASYVAEIANPGGVVFSSAATLTIATSVAPTFTAQPTSQTMATGSSVVFTASASGAPNPTYKWRKDGTDLIGATNSILFVQNVSSTNAGNYTCVATNSAGSATSSSANLAVTNTTAANTGHLSNLSVRTFSGTSDQVLNVGFAIGGAGTSGQKPLLVRVGGPALAAFGVGGTMVDPTVSIEVQGSTTVVAANDDWAGNANVASVSSSVGAFPFTDPTSKDAAVVTSLQAGTYATLAAGKNNTSGIVLTEIYDATPTSSFTSNTPRLINVSARAQVGTGDGVLIAGFVVAGSTGKTLLIRATGPALAGFGVGGTLADPKLQVYVLSGPLLYENDNWGGSPIIANVGGSVGAFPITDPNSKDSVMLVTLPPGTYTAQVSGADGGTGVALVEVYDVP